MLIKGVGGGYEIRYVRKRTDAASLLCNLGKSKNNIQKDEFQLTQEFISQMLGVRRTGVTEIAGKFQKADIIHYKRGLIRIVSQEKLEDRACECYWLIAKEFSRLLDSFSP